MHDDRIYLTAPQVCERYSITDMTLWRWLINQELGFPAPIKINRRRYFRESDLIDWERAQAGRVA